MRALLTGASGFLGRRLARRLVDQGWDVSALVRSSTRSSPVLAPLVDDGLTLVPFNDLAEVAELTRSTSPDVTFHLATHYLRGHSTADIAPLIEANISFGTNVLQGCAASGTTFVSTMSFFQFRHGRPEPISLYSATKQAFLAICNFYRDCGGLDIRQVILYDTYGADDPRDKLVPQLFAAARTGAELQLGSSLQPINLLYGDDVVSGLIAASAESERSELTLRAPRTVTLSELAEAVRVATRVPLNVIFHDERPVNDLVEVAGDWPVPSGWAPTVDLVEGLRRSWETSASDE